MSSDNIIFLYNQKAIIYDGYNIQSADFKDSKKYFTAAIIPLKYLNTFSYKIANTTNDDEIAIQTEIKMYSEGGLNADKEYVVDYIKYDIGSDYLVEAFALSKEHFDEYFGEYTKKVAAIDMVFPQFLVYQSLYDNKLDKQSNDLIIYISETESFAALYQNGRYIGHRILSSLSDISKKTGIEIVKLKEYLQTKGLIQSNYTMDETHILDSIQSILFKDIEKIMYSINHKRSLFGFDALDKVFIDFNNHNILGLEQLFVPYGYDSLTINTFDFKEDEKFGNIFLYVDYLYKLNSMAKEDNNYQHLNFSFLERRKPIFEYLLVKYSFVFAFSVIICLIIYTYIEILLFQQQSEINQKQTALKEEKAKYLKFEKKLQKIKKEYTDLHKKQNKIEDSIFVYENTINTIPLIQNAKYKRQKFMNDVILALAKFKLNTQFIKQHNDKTMDIMLISNSKNRENIAKFINELLKKQYHNVSTKQIYLDKTIYKSLIRIEL
ncbi:hypothetical protein [Sulfurimonas autotrophica]|uniref:Uncharacterized protein n=1 Tax=Sulfurimonas autotrophica (strain ATCC BAA-671 / DSM 16294 / JCM 11897 / OK10) TaxID=563040 RepID=E0UUY9_SULAO|nr:hypothetical protein [Sulfurimonas autotrophica]ADN08501.1 conserved hypothetical protein [Sulfurimonas autotrophica DSM 16294]